MSASAAPRMTHLLDKATRAGLAGTTILRRVATSTRANGGRMRRVHPVITSMALTVATLPAIAAQSARRN
jgi:hypothetical protein